MNDRRKEMLFAALTCALGLVLAESSAAGQARRVVLRAPSRGLSLACSAALGGQTFSFNEDAWYAQARASLRDPTQFGPSGTVRIEFVFGPPFNELRPEVLDGADVLVLNPYSPMPQVEELRAFGAYARQGVGFVSFQNAAATFFASPGRCVGENLATLAPPAGNPVLQGPFGALSGTYVTGYNCAFAMLDPLARALSSNSAGPNGIMIDLGMRIPRGGRAVSFGDEELFGNLNLPGCGAAGFSRGSSNDTLLRNVFAWVGETGHDPIPSSIEGMGDTDGDGITDDLDGDTDNDGVLDGWEAGDLDPATAPIDTDRDGTPDYKDPDADGDGLSDTVEHGGTIYDPLIDTDRDGTPDARDLDSDDDGLPDAREPAGDADRDGVANVLDPDADGDGVRDGRDLCPVLDDPEQLDRDRDGVGDPCDNCPTVANPEQSDLDRNRVGDACEPGDGGAPDAALRDAEPADASALGDGSPALDAGPLSDAAAVAPVTDGATLDGGESPAPRGGCGCRIEGPALRTGGGGLRAAGFLAICAGWARRASRRGRGAKAVRA
jgi:hypothetical protein